MGTSRHATPNASDRTRVSRRTNPAPVQRSQYFGQNYAITWPTCHRVLRSLGADPLTGPQGNVQADVGVSGSLPAASQNPRGTHPRSVPGTEEDIMADRLSIGRPDKTTSHYDVAWCECLDRSGSAVRSHVLKPGTPMLSFVVERVTREKAAAALTAFGRTVIKAALRWRATTAAWAAALRRSG